MILAKHDQKPGGAQSEDRSESDHAARRRQRGLERHDDQPDRGERNDAAGRGGDGRHQSGQRQRGQHMRALIPAGTGQIMRDQDRNDEPAESDHFDRARRAADQEIGGKAGERDDAAEKARRNESAMARRGQHVALRGRMDQRVNIVTNRRKQAQFPLHARLSRRAPFFLWARSCQRPLKRKLRSPARGRSPHRRRAQWRIRRNGFRRHGERLVAKIDAAIARRGRRIAELPISVRANRRQPLDSSAQCGEPAFVQILGKQDYFKLIENLRLILVNYAQKRTE